MRSNKRKIASERIKSVTYLGIAANTALLIVKLAVGYLSGSMALIADGIHSLSDMTTDLAILIGVHAGSKQPDESHPYGHGRAETFSAGFIALVLVGIGLAMIYYAAIDIARGHLCTMGGSVLAVAIISIVAKELIYRITKQIAVKSHSPALYANAWHHRSDALSSIAVAIGFLSLRCGFKFGDQIAAIAVGLMVIFVAVRVVGDCLTELTEGAVDPHTIEQIKDIINTNGQIHHWHRLRTRTVGREVFLDLHILVDPNLNVAAAHEIAENLETSLHKQITRPVNIIVHIEPDIPALRK